PPRDGGRVGRLGELGWVGGPRCGHGGRIRAAGTPRPAPESGDGLRGRGPGSERGDARGGRASPAHHPTRLHPLHQRGRRRGGGDVGVDAAARRSGERMNVHRGAELPAEFLTHLAGNARVDVSDPAALRRAWEAWATLYDPNGQEPSQEAFDAYFTRPELPTPLKSWRFAGTVRKSQQAILEAAREVPPDRAGEG